MCRTSIVPGTYTIRTKLTFIDIYDVQIAKAKSDEVPPDPPLTQA